MIPELPELQATVDAVLQDRMTPAQRLVLRMEFGLLGVTVSRISQIRAAALRKLRHPSRAKKLAPLLPDSSRFRGALRLLCFLDLQIVLVRMDP